MKRLFTWKGAVLGVLAGILAMFALIALWTVSDSRLPQSHVAAAGSTLRSLGDHIGILMGAAVGYSNSFADQSAMGVMKREYSLFVHENELKWPAVEPQQNQFDFGKADAMVDVAVANTMKVRGHNLAWADQPV
jgi:endo-1,4-beta-xylanase